MKSFEPERGRSGAEGEPRWSGGGVERRRGGQALQSVLQKQAEFLADHAAAQSDQAAAQFQNFRKDWKIQLAQVQRLKIIRLPEKTV